MELKQQLAELRTFVSVRSVPDAPDKKYLHISCGGLRLNDPRDPPKSRGGFMVEPDGPVLFLWRDDNRARVLLEPRTTNRR